MAKNRHLEEARYVELTVPEGTVSGDPVVVGQIPAVAVIDRQADGKATCQRDGAYHLDVKGVEKEGKEAAIAEGDIVFLKEGVLSVDNTGVRFGYAGAPVVKNKTENIPVYIGY